MRTCWVIAALALAGAVACKSDPEPGSDTPDTGSGSGSAGSATAPPEHMHGGFGASLGDDLAKGSNGSAIVAAGSSATTGSAATGSAATADAGSATPATTDNSTMKPVPTAGSGVAAANPPPSAGSAGVVPTVAVGSGGGSAAPAPVVHVPVKLTPELAAIGLGLGANWKRDVVEGGSFSLSVDPPSGGAAKVFTFYYGYDDPKAPADRDAYLKWLGDAHLLDVKLNRQSGAAWYIQGTDGNGAPSFRYLVNYGGKHLICYGSLYKDPESSRLGDIRDDVVNQAKKICESIRL